MLAPEQVLVADDGPPPIEPSGAPPLDAGPRTNGPGTDAQREPVAASVQGTEPAEEPFMERREVSFDHFESPSEAARVIGEAELEALAGELLSVNSEAELDSFFGKLLGKVGSAVGKGVKSLGKGLKAIAPTVLPMLGKVAGGAFGGPLGAMLVGKLGSLAGQVVEKLEVEALTSDGNELELARRFVEFAERSARNLASARPGSDDATTALQAMARAAEQMAGQRGPRRSTSSAGGSPLFGWLSRTARSTPAANDDDGELELPYGAPSGDAGVRAAIAAGERNENTLTNLIFYQRHPELGGRPLTPSQPGFSALSREWLTLLDSTVRPLLQAPPPPDVGAPWPSNGGSPRRAPSTGAGPRLLVPETDLTSLLPAFTRYLYNESTPHYPWLPPGASSSQKAPPDDTNCCAFVEALLWRAWSRRHGSAFRWGSEQHGKANVWDHAKSKLFSSVDVYVEAGIATALPAGALPQSWCVVQGWRSMNQLSGHNFIVVARHPSDRVLILEANTSGAGLNGVGFRGFGPLRELNGLRPPARWWEGRAPRWSDLTTDYREGLKLAKLGVTGTTLAAV